MGPLGELEDYLLNAEILHSSSFLQQGAHQSFLLILEGGVGVLAKPEDTEPHPGSAKREVAAWSIAKALGWPDLMATTVLRTIERNGTPVDASIAVLWPSPQPDADPSNFTDEDIWRAAVFDAVIGAGDRAGHNWLAVPEPGLGSPRLKLIDHGYAFDAQPFASTFFSLKQGQKIPHHLVEAVEDFLRDWPDTRDFDYLEQEAVDKVEARAQKLVQDRELTI